MTERIPSTQAACLRLWLSVAYNSFLWLLSQGEVQEKDFAGDPSLPLRLSKLVPEFIAWQAAASRKESLLWLVVDTHRDLTFSSRYGYSAEHREQVAKAAKFEHRRLEAVRIRYHTILNGIRSNSV